MRVGIAGIRWLPWLVFAGCGDLPLRYARLDDSQVIDPAGIADIEAQRATRDDVVAGLQRHSRRRLRTLRRCAGQGSDGRLLHPRLGRPNGIEGMRTDRHLVRQRRSYQSRTWNSPPQRQAARSVRVALESCGSVGWRTRIAANHAVNSLSEASSRAEIRIASTGASGECLRVHRFRTPFQHQTPGRSCPVPTVSNRPITALRAGGALTPFAATDS